MAACPCCTGTHYLNDTPDLGPCICCTPENMQKLDRTIHELTKPPGPIEWLDMLEAGIDGVRSHIATVEAERDAEAAKADALWGQVSSGDQ